MNSQLDKKFNYKINQHLDNPYGYTLDNLYSDFNLTPEQLQGIINDNDYLKLKYQNIINSQKITAEKLYEDLINSIPPNFQNKDDFKNAMQNPVFNLAYSFLFLDEKTIDFYKLEYEKKISESDLKSKIKSYVSKSSEMSEAFKRHKLKIVLRNKDNYLNYEF